MRIAVALSGGIDSSVVAHMLAEQGHEVVAIRFTLWSDPLAPAVAQMLPSKCCTTQNAFRAEAVARQLSIPLHIIDFADAFKENVVDPYLEAHRRGETPNPCIGCNRTVKFGRLLDEARSLGCELLATGHYARIATERLHDGSERTLLLEASDIDKDQSYFLYGLGQEQLRRVRFPLGQLHKSEVYALAERFGVPFDDASYRESQDLCFFPEKSPGPFLKRHLAGSLAPGPIIRHDDGVVVGQHDGLALYTMGQRHGLRIGGQKIPLEVVAKRAPLNALVVAPRGSVRHATIELADVRFVSWEPGPEPQTFECRVRSLGQRLRGTLQRRDANTVFTLEEAQVPLAPGQSVVFYRGAEIVGGGVVQASG